MTRRFLLLSAIPAAWLAAQEPADDLRARVMDLERPWNLFIRRLFGCPAPTGATNPETCRPSAAQVDLASFDAAGRAAAKLWPGKVAA